MTKAAKVKIFGSLVVIGAVLECTGLYKLAGSLLGGESAKSVGLVIAGFLLGVPAAIAWQFFKTRPDTSLDKNKVAVETLANMPKATPKIPPKGPS